MSRSPRADPEPGPDTGAAARPIAPSEECRRRTGTTPPEPTERPLPVFLGESGDNNYPIGWYSPHLG